MYSAFSNRWYLYKSVLNILTWNTNVCIKTLTIHTHIPIVVSDQMQTVVVTAFYKLIL